MGNIEIEVPRRKPIFEQNKYNMHAFSPEKRKENRVKDFNDFLREIKKHIPSDATSSPQSQELVLKFRLENQRVELEKYRKMAERELSRNHSVESITIQGEQRDKVVTIQLEEKPTREDKINQGEKEMLRRQFDRGKSVYRELQGRMEVLEQLIGLCEKKQRPALEIINLNRNNQKEKTSLEGELSSHMGRIEGLLGNLNNIHSKQAAMEGELKSALEFKEDDSEESMGTIPIL